MKRGVPGGMVGVAAAVLGLLVATAPTKLRAMQMWERPDIKPGMPPVEEPLDQETFDVKKHDDGRTLPIPQKLRDELPEDLLEKLTDRDIIMFSSRTKSDGSGLEMSPRNGRARRTYKYGECETMGMETIDDCIDACMNRGYTSAALTHAIDYLVCTCSVSPSGYSTHYCGPQLMAVYRPKGFPRSYYGWFLRSKNKQSKFYDIPMRGSDFGVKDFGVPWPSAASYDEDGFLVWDSPEARQDFFDSIKNGVPDSVPYNNTVAPHNTTNGTASP